MTDFNAARIAMVDCQVRPSDVTLYPVIEAMLAIPREEFVPRDMRDVAYASDHIPLGPDRVVLDSRVMAKILDALNIQPDDMVLEIERWGCKNCTENGNSAIDCLYRGGDASSRSLSVRSVRPVRSSCGPRTGPSPA